MIKLLSMSALLIQMLSLMGKYVCPLSMEAIVKLRAALKGDPSLSDRLKELVIELSKNACFQVIRQQSAKCSYSTQVQTAVLNSTFYYSIIVL